MMKTDDLLMMMAAAVGVFLIANMSKARAATTTATGVKTVSPVAGSNQGFGNVISQWNGWTYFDTGYVKDAFGSIYFQGEKIADGIMGAV